MSNFNTLYGGTWTKSKTHEAWRQVLPQIMKAKIVELTDSDFGTGVSCGSCLIVPGGRAIQITDAGAEGHQTFRRYVGGGGGVSWSVFGSLSGECFL
ncbi:MAG: hypothetical protein JJU29_01775 [Verrucomicrobia bacterium]|nr:hypothetical protein [Verrucomicrobiota bacterium]MCH8510962.1 hypothetical protein [Kiritimatiellia bacterium]